MVIRGLKTPKLTLVMIALSAVPLRGQVFSWEANSFPNDAGWEQVSQFCEPETWIEDGWYVQDVDMDACPDETEGAADSYRRYLLEFLGTPTFFVEWEVEGDGDQSEIIGGAPAALAVFNSHGIAYTFFIARDLAKLNRDNLLPEIHVEIEPGIAHLHRLELYGPDLYVWYIDGEVVDSGVPEGQFPADNARITFRGKSWHMPNVIRWNYIRYGVPSTSPGDFDSDGDIDQRDAFYFAECISDRGNGPGVPADSGCVDWADLDADGDVDFADMAEFQRIFTGEGE
jgi:hypothetical protein